MNCVLVIDQGTTSSRSILFDQNSRIVFTAQREFTQHFPADGWVEHCPKEIFQTVVGTAREVLHYASANNCTVAAIGITNQRETTIVWDKKTGEPIYNAIVWQDRRTADYCAQLKAAGHEEMIQARTGLLLDPYFSASKVNWILNNVDGARRRAENGELAFGTVDSYLTFKLTGGKSHVTDATNASRTSLFNIREQCWDAELLKLFCVPSVMLPQVLDCAADFGESDANVVGEVIPITGIAGDQQAAAIGQGCFTPGAIKSTYGTGCFVLTNSGEKIIQSKNKLLATVAYRLDGKTTYALEGSIFIAGASVQWLRDELQIIENAKQTESYARALQSNSGVYLVPAFTGLGAPYWDANSRGALFGITRATGRAELARAALESVCYQTSDLLNAMAEDGVKPDSLKIDGGMAANNWLAQFLSDVLNLPVVRAPLLETTALGAARLAGFKAGVYNQLGSEISTKSSDQFKPVMAEKQRIELLAGWKKSVEKVLT